MSELPTPYTSSRSLWSLGQNLLKVQRTRFKLVEICPSRQKPRLWTALPLSLHEAVSADSLKTILRHFWIQTSFKLILKLPVHLIVSHFFFFFFINFSCIFCVYC